MKYLFVYLLVNLFIFILLSDKTLSFSDIDISVPAFFYLCIYSIYLFMAVLGLWCIVLGFLSSGEWRLLSSCGVGASHYGGFFCCRAPALGHAG